RVIAAGVTAVVAYNDLMAIGLLRAAAEQGIDVPSRLSVSGFDEIFGSDFTSPALTTVRTPLARAGERAVRLALEMLGADDAPAPGDDEAIVTSLVVRGSTGPSDG
ncbi:substrate-binding domain-containing protein, partial [Mycetocola sp.]|uniref:substrate-binding domain-containing protein n=1 Tax=Mycetocola sp. TaxID=1871042 RepID=UPI00398986D0